MSRGLPAVDFQVFVEGAFVGGYTLPASDDPSVYWNKFTHVHFFCKQCAVLWCRHITSNERGKLRPHDIIRRNCPRHADTKDFFERCSLVPDPTREKLYLDNFDLSLLKYEFLLRTQEMSHEQNA